MLVDSPPQPCVAKIKGRNSRAAFGQTAFQRNPFEPLLRAYRISIER
jgi:hypothetical protein